MTTHEHHIHLTNNPDTIVYVSFLSVDASDTSIRVSYPMTNILVSSLSTDDLDTDTYRHDVFYNDICMMCYGTANHKNNVTGLLVELNNYTYQTVYNLFYPQMIPVSVNPLFKTSTEAPKRDHKQHKHINPDLPKPKQMPLSTVNLNQ